MSAAELVPLEDGGGVQAELRRLRDVVAAQGAALESLRAGQATSSALSPSATSRKAAPFVFAMSWVFGGGACVLACGLLSVLVLFAFDEYAYVPRSGAVQLFVLLSGAWGMFAFAWVSSYPPSVTAIRVTAVSVVLTSCMIAAFFCMVYASIVATVLGAVLAVSFLVFVPLSRQVFRTMAASIEELTIQAWLTVFRLFVVVAAPIASSFIRNDGAQTVYPFFALWSFVASATSLLVCLRLSFAMYPEVKSTAALILRLTTLQVAQFFGPSVASALVFVAFYLVFISGADVAAPGGLLIALTALLAATTGMFFQMAFAFATRWRILALFNPFDSDECYDKLHAAHERGKLFFPTSDSALSASESTI